VIVTLIAELIGFAAVRPRGGLCRRRPIPRRTRAVHRYGRRVPNIR